MDKDILISLDIEFGNFKKNIFTINSKNYKTMVILTCFFIFTLVFNSFFLVDGSYLSGIDHYYCSPSSCAFGAIYHFILDIFKVFNSAKLAISVNLISTALCVFPMYYIGKTLSKKRWVGFASSVFVMLNPLMLFYSGMITDDSGILLIFILLSLALYLHSKKSTDILSAFFCSLAVANKYATMGLFLVLLVLSIKNKRKIFLGSLLIFFILFSLGPIINIFNEIIHSRYGVFVLNIKEIIKETSIVILNIAKELMASDNLYLNIPILAVIVFSIFYKRNLINIYLVTQIAFISIYLGLDILKGYSGRMILTVLPLVFVSFVNTLSKKKILLSLILILFFLGYICYDIKIQQLFTDFVKIMNERFVNFNLFMENVPEGGLVIDRWVKLSLYQWNDTVLKKIKIYNYSEISISPSYKRTYSDLEKQIKNACNAIDNNTKYISFVVYKNQSYPEEVNISNLCGKDYSLKYDLKINWAQWVSYHRSIQETYLKKFDSICNATYFGNETNCINLIYLIKPT